MDRGLGNETANEGQLIKEVSIFPVGISDTIHELRLSKTTAGH